MTFPEPRAGWQPGPHQDLVDRLRAEVAAELAAGGHLSGRDRAARVADLVRDALRIDEEQASLGPQDE